jgi:hypothetical protein
VIDTDAVQHSFAGALSDLQDSGSTVLVVGTSPEETAARMCSRLLGQHGRRPYDRLLLATEPGAEDRLDAEATGRAVIVERASLARSAAVEEGAEPHTATPGAAGASVERTVVEADALSTLGVTVADRVSALASDGSSGIRVGVESLDPLFAAHPARAVFQFAHLLGRQVRSAGGLLHAHLHAAADHEDAGLLRPAFDVVVELRRGPAGDQHRWHLPAQDRSTDWLGLDGDTGTGD